MRGPSPRIPIARIHSPINPRVTIDIFEGKGGLQVRVARKWYDPVRRFFSYSSVFFLADLYLLNKLIGDAIDISEQYIQMNPKKFLPGRNYLSTFPNRRVEGVPDGRFAEGLRGSPASPDSVTLDAIIERKPDPEVESTYSESSAPEVEKEAPGPEKDEYEEGIEEI